MTKFFQIAASQKDLFALDSEGQVWRWSQSWNSDDNATWTWKKLAMPEGEISPVRELHDDDLQTQMDLHGYPPEESL